MDASGRLQALLARTARAFVPALARPDDAFAEAWLPEPERALYRAMDVRDRDHGCRVARRLLQDHPDADPAWVRAALLHDVGKSVAPYRAWERIAVHLVRRGARRGAHGGAAPRGPLGRAVARDRDHAAVGARMLAAAGAEARVVDLVAHHHRPPGGDPAAAALAAADAAADAGAMAVAAADERRAGGDGRRG